MSADVQQSGMAVAAVDTAAPVPVGAPAELGASENVGVGVPALAVPRRRKLGLAASGYLLLTLATLLAILLPRMRMKAGFLEDALVIVSILGMIAGVGMVMLSFVWNLLRQI